MNIKSLSWTAAFTLLAITGSAMAQEPGAVTNYKSKVTTEINNWARNLDQDDTSLQKVAGEWHVVKDSMDKAVKARETLEKDRQSLETAKKDLEKKRDELQKEADKLVDAVKKGATIVLINKTKDEITKKTAEITAKTADIQKAAGEEKKIDAELAKKKADVVNVVKTVELHNNVGTAIGQISSPSKEDEKRVLEKDTRGAYRTEWGPTLATWMEGQLNAKKQKWKEIGANVKVNWTQSALEKKMGPVVTVTLKLPDVNAKPARGALNMR